MDKKNIIVTICSIVISLLIGYTVGVSSKNKQIIEQGMDRYIEHTADNTKEGKEEGVKVTILEPADEEEDIEEILKQKTNVKENYNRDDEIEKDIELLTKMFSRENEYLYNSFLSTYFEDIDCSLSIDSIEVATEGTVAMYKIEIANTDASCWFEKDTAIEEIDGNWFLPPTNKYGSDYHIIYFTNGVPSNSKDIYAKVYDENEVSFGGITDYKEGDKNIHIETANGKFVTIDLED